MKTLNKKITLPAAFLVTAPMLILGGCAGNDTKSFSGDVTQGETQINQSITSEEMMQEHLDTMSADLTGLPEVQDEVVENSGVDESEVLAGVETEMVVEETLVEPVEKIIGFGFDQSDIDMQYTEMLIQHAEYLRQNKSLLLNVSGHTDNSGDSTYNKLLSKKRADAVANVLVELGVPEEQIKITGNASEEPLAGALSHREHRRVELNYQDQQIVSN